MPKLRPELKERAHAVCPTATGSPNQDYRKIEEDRSYDPYHDSVVEHLVGIGHDAPEATYLVYLDDRLNVVWCSTNAARKTSPGMRRSPGTHGVPRNHAAAACEAPAAGRIQETPGRGREAIPQLSRGCGRVAERGGKRFALFAEAERRINQWNYEFTLCWYAIATVTMLFVQIGLNIAMSRLAHISEVTWELMQMGFAGALGALLSILVGLRTSPARLRMDVSGSRITYFITVIVKIGVGMLAAVIVGVAMRADLLLTVLKHNPLAMPTPFTISAMGFVICFLAGFAERFVPRFLMSERSHEALEERLVVVEASDPGARRGGH